MADFTLERTGELIRKVFQVLWYQPDGLPANEIFSQVSANGFLTEAEREPHPEINAACFEVAIWQGMVPLARVGWLKKNRGRWCITEEGRQACKRFATNTEFYAEAARISEGWQRNHTALSLVTEIAESLAWKQLRGYLLSLNRQEFLTLVADLLKAMDYHVGWIAPPEKTRGQIDMIAYTDPLGASGHRIKVHIQHSEQATMQEGLRSFLVNLSPGDVGLFVSSGGFSASAREFIHERTDVQVTLLDLEGFLNLWIDFYPALTDEARRRFSLKAVHFLLLG